jgi:hypothetical protein
MEEDKMFVELSKKLSEVDNSLGIVLNVSKNIFTVGVYSSYTDIIYSFSSTDLLEAYQKVDNFINCLKSSEEFDKLVKEIEEEAIV